VRGNSLIFSRSGYADKLYGVDPLLFPQYTTFNKYFLPTEHELPAHGLRTRFLPFDFGYNDPMLAISPYDSVPVSLPMENNFLAEIITGTYSVQGPTGATTVASLGGALIGVNMTPGYLINFQQTHNGKTRQWANKAVSNAEAVGTAENPLLFKHPILIPAGDMLTCTIQNLMNATLQVQLLLTGGEF
jgi:hypothetical protein